jgi:hypothetical protein
MAALCADRGQATLPQDERNLCGSGLARDAFEIQKSPELRGFQAVLGFLL